MSLAEALTDEILTGIRPFVLETLMQRLDTEDAVRDEICGPAASTFDPGSRTPLGGPFPFLWPDQKECTYATRDEVDELSGHYLVHKGGKSYELTIANELGGRSAFGRLRERYVVFSSLDGTVRSPVVEMVETDLSNMGDPLYAITVPKPDQPRSMARATDLGSLLDLPHLHDGADVRRTDEVFAGTANGPSLRLVVTPSDRRLILEHAVWVGEIRGGGRLLLA